VNPKAAKRRNLRIFKSRVRQGERALQYFKRH
jgi:hypothetical protein